MDLIVIMAKEPAPGAVKTRLQPDLTPAESAALYDCLLKDRIESVQDLAGVEKAIAYTPAAALPYFERLAPREFTLFPQRGWGLSARLSDIVASRQRDRGGGIVIVDSDSPDLPVDRIPGALRSLRRGTDVVFGPCHDGGYYLVAVKGPAPGLFEGIPWSTGEVLQTSLERASFLGLKSALLPPWGDIDTFTDLEACFARLEEGTGRGGVRGRHTRAWLERLAGEGRIAGKGGLSRGSGS